MRRNKANLNQLLLFPAAAAAAPAKPPRLEFAGRWLPARDGAVHELFRESWVVHRISPGAPGQEFVLRSARRSNAFLVLSFRRWVKLTSKACRVRGGIRSRQPYCVPCMDCRVPVDQPSGTLLCSACREARKGELQ